ncbi:MAG: cobalt ECF transporter T component CbiQ [Ruminococcus sp.]|jgi:cobalt/nickel transport system permease protein
MITIDKLCYRSKLRYENAAEKFAFAVITLLICVMSRSAAVAGIVLAVTGILTVWKGGIPVLRYIRFLTVPLAFLFLGTVAIMFNISRTPLDLFALPVGDWYLTASSHSFFYAVRLILTALAAVSCLYFLSFTTPMPDILQVLKKLRCPKLLIEMMLLIYRFIFVLLDTASAISTSQDCRLGNRNYKTALKSFGMLGSVLMIRAVSRSNRLYDAMEARCYDGTIRVLPENHPPKRKVIAAIACFEILLFLFAVWRRFFS